MGKSKVLTRAQGVMDVVTYEKAKQLLLLYVFLQRKAGLGECLSCSAFSRASLRHLTVLTKKDLLAQTTEECCYGSLGKSWFTSGKLGAGARQTEPPRAQQCGSTPMHSEAFESTDRNQQIHMPQA